MVILLLNLSQSMPLANLSSSKAEETTENFFKDIYFFFAALSYHYQISLSYIISLSNHTRVWASSGKFLSSVSFSHAAFFLISYRMTRPFYSRLTLYWVLCPHSSPATRTIVYFLYQQHLRVNRCQTWAMSQHTYLPCINHLPVSLEET